MYDPNRHHRRSVRLPDMTYAEPGGYFVTLCVEGKVCLFGDVVDAEMHPNAFGKIVQEEWDRTATVRPYVELDAFVVMPNHIHGIIIIRADGIDTSEVGATRRIAPTNARGPEPGSIGAMIGQFKSAATKRINHQRGTPGVPVWQRNYHEHIIRSGRDIDRIRQYIAENPARWHYDRYHDGPPFTS